MSCHITIIDPYIGMFNISKLQNAFQNGYKFDIYDCGILYKASYQKVYVDRKQVYQIGRYIDEEMLLLIPYICDNEGVMLIEGTNISNNLQHFSLKCDRNIPIKCIKWKDLCMYLVLNSSEYWHGNIYFKNGYPCYGYDESEWFLGPTKYAQLVEINEQKLQTIISTKDQKLIEEYKKNIDDKNILWKEVNLF